jgi:hypothetical protein
MRFVCVCARVRVCVCVCVRVFVCVRVCVSQVIDGGAVEGLVVSTGYSGHGLGIEPPCSGRAESRQHL